MCLKVAADVAEELSFRILLIGLHTTLFSNAREYLRDFSISAIWNKGFRYRFFPTTATDVIPFLRGIGSEGTVRPVNVN